MTRVVSHQDLPHRGLPDLGFGRPCGGPPRPRRNRNRPGVPPCHADPRALVPRSPLLPPALLTRAGSRPRQAEFESLGRFLASVTSNVLVALQVAKDMTATTGTRAAASSGAGSNDAPHLHSDAKLGHRSAAPQGAHPRAWQGGARRLVRGPDTLRPLAKPSRDCLSDRLCAPPRRLPAVAIILEIRSGKPDTRTTWPAVDDDDAPRSWEVAQLQDLVEEGPEAHAEVQRCLSLQLLVRRPARPTTHGSRTSISRAHEDFPSACAVHRCGIQQIWGLLRRHGEDPQP